MTTYYNPYSHQTFFGFFKQLMIRFYLFLSGQIHLPDLVSDEIQILVLVGVSASAALVGSFLILKKMTMLANAFSHTILLGIVTAYLLTKQIFVNPEGVLDIQSMLIASLIVALVTAFLTEFLTKTVQLQEDASTGLVFTTLFALGIVLVTLMTRSVHIGLEAVMGNVDALQLQDCRLIYMILFFNVLLFILFFKEYKITTFDSSLAKSFGIPVLFLNYLLMVQASATLVGAFRAVGVLMVLAFITGPPLIARLLTHELKKMLLLAPLIGAIASLLGVALSRHIFSVYGMALSTAGIVVCVIVCLFISVVFYFSTLGSSSKSFNPK